MTREEMWEEFESQLKREVRTPITMSYDESIRIAEMGIKDVVKKWKKRLDQEPKTGHWIKMPLIETRQTYSHECSLCGRRILTTDVGLSEFPYCHCGAKMESEDE